MQGRAYIIERLKYAAGLIGGAVIWGGAFYGVYWVLINL